MKVHSFLVAFATALLAVSLLSVFAAEVIAVPDSIMVENQILEIPQTAEFVPKKAALSIHLLIDPNRFSGNLDSVTASPSQTEAIEMSKDLSKGLFALAGLDFKNELSEWIGPEISFGLLEPNEAQPAFHWVLALSSLEKNGAKDFIEHFWQKKNLTGTILSINKYKGIPLISSENYSQSNQKISLATALVSNNLLLIASDKKTLEKSLTISQFPTQNQFGQEKLGNSIKNLTPGLALITVSPKILESLFEIPPKFSQRTDLNGLVATVKLNKEDITLSGVFDFENLPEERISLEPLNPILINPSNGQEEAIAIINSPSKIIASINRDPIAQLIGPRFIKEIKKANHSSIMTIAGHDENSLIWLQEPAGWVLGTPKDNPSISLVAEALKNQSRSDVIVNDQTYKVWSKIITKRIKGNDALDTELGAILLQDAETNWWGETLAALQQQQEKIISPKPLLLARPSPNNNVQDALQLSLNKNQANTELSNWQPWRLMQSLTGHSYESLVQGVALRVEPNWTQEDPTINLDLTIKLA